MREAGLDREPENDEAKVLGELVGIGAGLDCGGEGVLVGSESGVVAQEEEAAEEGESLDGHSVVGEAGNEGGVGDEVAEALGHCVEQVECEVGAAAFGVERDEGVGGERVECRGGVEEPAVEDAAEGEVARADAGPQEVEEVVLVGRRMRGFDVGGDGQA